MPILFAPAWIAGLRRLLRADDLRRFRPLGNAYVALLAISLLVGAKPYYTTPLLIVLLAAGGVSIERWLRRHRQGWRLVAVALAVSAVVSIGLALPVIPVADVHATPVPAVNEDAIETIGWPRLVATVARVWRRLPPQERAHAVIFTGNYGEAGAVDRFGPPLGLARAYSRSRAGRSGRAAGRRGHGQTSGPTSGTSRRRLRTEQGSGALPGLPGPPRHSRPSRRGAHQFPPRSPTSRQRRSTRARARRARAARPGSRSRAGEAESQAALGRCDLDGCSRRERVPAAPPRVEVVLLQGLLTIGELARRAGRRPSSIRYYEEIGVLPAPTRVSGRRRYGDDVVRMLAVVDTAQRAGLTLDEIRALLAAAPGDPVAIEELRAIAERKLPAVEAAIERSLLVKSWLEAAARCDCPSLDDCPLFDAEADPCCMTIPTAQPSTQRARRPSTTSSSARRISLALSSGSVKPL